MIVEAVEVLIHAVVRIIVIVIYEVFFQTIFYYIGWPFVKLFTLGKWPDERIESRQRPWSASGDFTSAIGLMVSICVMVYLF